MGSSENRVGPKSMKSKWKLTAKGKAGKGIISTPINGASAKTKTFGQLYIVEKIIEKKIENKVPKYLIKWDGWPSSTNTWEPVDHIPQGMIKEFEDEMSSKTSSSLSPISEDGVTITGESTTNGSMEKKLEAKDKDGSDYDMDTDYINTKNEDQRLRTIYFAKNVRAKKLTKIETVTFKPLKNDPRRKHRLIFIVKFKGAETAEAITSSDAYSLFPNQVIEYFESIISFF